MRPALKGARDILQNEKQVIGVEVGVLRGENAREILREWSEVKKLFLVDNYICGMKEFETAKELLREWKDRFVWVMEDSVEASKKLPELDFVYIDGDHSYDGVKRDIEAYWPKIRQGGCLAGHDYQFRWTSVQGLVKAVDEFVKDNNLILKTETSGSSSDWWMIKP